MHLILTLLRKDLQLFLRDRAALSLTFLVPIVLIYILGNVFGVAERSDGPGKIPLAIVTQSESPLVAAMVEALEQEPAFRLIRTAGPGPDAPTLTEASAREAMRKNQFRFAVIFPPDTESPDRFGAKLRILSNPRNEIETQTATGLLQKAIYTSAPQTLMRGLQQRAEAAIGIAGTETFHRRLAQTIAASFGGDAEAIFGEIRRGEWGFGAEENAAPVSDGASFLEELVMIETEQVAGQAVKSPSATRSVGGWAIMFLLFSVSGSATSLFDEKKAGLFQRLLAGPVRRSHVLWSKYLFGVGLGLVQLLTLFGAGRLMFGIDITSNVGNLLLISLATALACTAFGMVLAAICRTPAAAQGLATFLVLTMSAVGGAWFPVTLMPDVIQQFSKLTVVYWAMEGFLAVLWAGQGLMDILPELGVLLGMAAVLIAASLWQFRRGTIFR